MLPNRVIGGVTKKNTFFDDFILREPLDKSNFGSSASLHWEYSVQKKLHGFFLVPEVYDYKDNSYKMKIIHGDSTFSTLEMFDMLKKIHDNKIIIKDKGMNNKKFVDFWKKQHTSLNNKENSNDIILWLEMMCPEDTSRSMLHGDWKVDNLIFKNKKIVGILDWELSGVGDPRIDIGVSMAYWNNLIIGKTNDIKKEEIIEFYGYDIPKFFYVFGFFRLSVLIEMGRESFLNNKICDKKYENTKEIINNTLNQCRFLINE